MQQGSKEWLDWRKTCAATCSEYGSALGISKYTSRKQYMKMKLQLIPGKEGSWFTERGTAYEPWICKEYERIMREFYNTRVVLSEDGGREDWLDKRLGGSVDRIVSLNETFIDPDYDARTWIIEVKTGKRDIEEIPIEHVVQMMGLCHIYKVDFCHYVRWCEETKEIYMCQVEWDDECYLQHIAGLLSDFADLFDKKELPENLNKEEKKNLIRLIRDNTIVTKIRVRR